MKNQIKLSDLCKLLQSNDKTEEEFEKMLSFFVVSQTEKTVPATEKREETIAPLRSDNIEKSLEKSEVLALAPRQEEGFVVIPPTLEEE